MSTGATVAIFFAIVIALTIGWTLLSRAMDASFNVLIRNIFYRSSHKTGDYLIKNPLVFTTQANFDTLKTRIFNDIVPPDRNASWMPSLYLAGAGTNSNGEYVATFRKDTKLNYGLEVEVKLRPDAAGTVGSVDVMRWRLTDGVIQHVNEMKMLRQRVEQIVLSLDPHAQLSHRTQAAAPPPQQFAPPPQQSPPQQFAAPPASGGWTPQPPLAPAAPPARSYGHSNLTPSAGYAPGQGSGWGPGYPDPNVSQPFGPPAHPPVHAAPLTAPPVPHQGSRYPVPDTRSWTDRSQG